MEEDKVLGFFHRKPNPERRCVLCGKKDIVEEHHLIWKVLGGTDKDGRALLCNSCHDILHWRVMLTFLKYGIVTFVDKKVARENVKELSLDVARKMVG